MIFKKKLLIILKIDLKSPRYKCSNIARNLEFNFSKIYEINNLGDIEFKCFFNLEMMELFLGY